jgi:hypothetical protein
MKTQQINLTKSNSSENECTALHFITEHAVGLSPKILLKEEKNFVSSSGFSLYILHLSS